MAFDPQAPVDAAFAAFGVDAVVDPDGPAPATLRVIPDEASATEFVQGRDLVADRSALRVRAADLAALPSGRVVALPNGRRVVRGAPRWTDPRRLVALVPTVSEP